MEEKYGIPDVLACAFDVDPDEYKRINRSASRGRIHDITLFIAKDGGFVFIAKHSYPLGLFRAPSGGLEIGEDFVTGAKREAFEETGVEIEIKKYILRINARFHSPNGHIDWITHVFSARYLSGEIMPHDTFEIREARLVMPDEIPGFQDTMRKSGIGGFQYRAFLTEETLKRL